MCALPPAAATAPVVKPPRLGHSRVRRNGRADVMVRIGAVWDSALEAVRGRAGMILPIAALALFLPSVVQSAMGSYLAPTPGTAPNIRGSLLVMIVSVGLMLLTLWGALAITAITTHPEVTSAEAGRRASARLLPLVGVSVVLALAFALLVVPLFGLFAAAGVDFTAMGTPGYQPPLSGGASVAALLYLLVVLGLALWVLARLLPLVPVVLHERRGLGAIGRAFRLTKGMGAKLVGVFILYIVVLGVSTLAVQSVLGLVFRLILGGDAVGTARFLGGVAGAVVSTALSVLSYAFVSRLYAMLAGSDLKTVFEDAPAR